MADYTDLGAQNRVAMSVLTENLSKNSEGIFQGASSTDAAINPFLHPYAFTMTKAYATRAQMLKDLLRLNSGEPASTLKSGQVSADALLSATIQDNAVFTRFSVADTSLGGQEPINGRWGFSRDDDIIHPMNALKGNPDLGGLGRVYSELYHSTQQLLHISVGVPEFQSLWEFYANCVDPDVVRDVNSGDGIHLGRLFGGVIGGAAKLAFKMFTWPYQFASWMADFLSPNERVTRYYDLQSAMPMYYRYVNSILVHLCCNMGWYPNSWNLPNSQNPKSDTGGTTSGTQSNAAYMDLLKNSGNDITEDTLPGFLRGVGPSIYKIISKRDYRLGLNVAMLDRDSDDFLKAESRKAADGGFWDIFTERARATATGADKFISFRINKSTDSSESISNSTGQSTIAQFLNSQASAGRDRTFSSGGSVLKNIPVFGSLLKGASDVLMGAATQVGMVGLASAVMTGSGFVDIPDVWMSSSFSKSYNFSFQLRAPAGDNLSITQSLYVPLAMLLPLACPRSVGLNSYTSPFLIKAYCKGMFAVPLGIVDSLNIQRGASEFGWNMSRLPTVLNISMTIKDLAPIMHLAIADGISGTRIFGNNTSFQEYLLTLSGMGLNERLLYLNNIVRRLYTINAMMKTTWGNPSLYFGTEMGNTVAGRIYGAVTSISTMPNS